MSQLKKIIVENKIPFITPLLDGLAEETTVLPPEEINAGSVADADALFVRTRTRCDAALLEGSRVKFVATATIGTDHIDLDYCRRRGIAVSNAPGCNAPAVAQWVFAAILALRHGDVSGLTLGVIGAGHVGSIVVSWGRSLGMNVMVCDPPRQLREGNAGFTTLDEIARHADIITFHTPLDNTTRHLADSSFFNALERRPLILNAARGPVTDTEALIAALSTGKVSGAAIDCWEGEPDIDRRLLDLTGIATQHIAGYSLQGKLRAAMMVSDALRRHLGLQPRNDTANLGPTPQSVTIADITASYDILADDRILRRSPGDFETLRDSYPLRNEINQH